MFLRKPCVLLVGLLISWVTGLDKVRLNENGEFVDDTDRILLFHGFNSVVKHPPWYDEQLTNRTQLKMFQSWGINFVRLGVMWSGVMPKEGQIEEEYLKKISDIIRVCAEYGIYVLIDLHQDLLSSRFGGYDGIPLWLVDKMIRTPTNRRYPWPFSRPPEFWFENYLTYACVDCADRLYKNHSGSWVHWGDFWQVVASRLGRSSNVIGYELLNEPPPANFYDDPRNALPDVHITRTSDGTVQRRVHRKTTWTGQYTHFASFVPMSQKRNLFRCLTERARKICTEDALSDELSFTRSVLEQIGYPDKFIRRHMEPRAPKVQPITAEKRLIYLSLPFKGDVIAERTTRRLCNATARTYFAADLRVSFTSTPVVSQHLKGRLPRSNISFCVYHFSCSCRASYIGKTTRRLSERVREHCPAWLYTGVRKTVVSAVLGHLADTNHQVNVREAFRPIYRISGRHRRGLRCRLLVTAEAIAIRLHNPELCVQKKFVHALQLPWPQASPCYDTTPDPSTNDAQASVVT